MTTGVFALLLMQVMLTWLAPVDAQCSFPAQLQTTNLPLTIARNFNIQTQAKDVVQMDVTSGTSISFTHLKGYSFKITLATWNCVNVTSAGNTFVVMVTDFGGTTPVTYYTCVSFTSVTTNIWLLWQQSPGVFNTSDTVLCNNLTRNSWPIVILPVTSQMPPIPSTEQGGYDVISTYVISSQTNLSCISAAAPSVVGRVDIGCGASRTDCTLLLPPSCRAPVMALDGFMPFTMSVIAWWQERNYNYFILNNYAQQMACLRIQRSGTNVTSFSLSAILFTDVTCPDTPYNATNPDMTVFSNALLLTLQRTSFMTSLCADQYASCSALAPSLLADQCSLASQQCLQTCSKCTPTISAFYPNNFSCISSSISGHWAVVGSDKRTASLQASSISFDYENRTLSCLLQQAAANISSSSGGSSSYPMVMMQANGCYPRMMCVTASLVQPASFQLEFQRVATWPDTTLTLFDPKTLCTLPPTSLSDPTLILLATPRQPVNCGLVLTNSITGLIMNPIYNITAISQSNVTTAVMQSSCNDPTKLNIVSGDPLFMSTMFNLPPNLSTSSLQLRCLASFQHLTVNVVTMLLDTGSDGSPLYCIIADNMNNKLYIVSLSDCSDKAYGRIGAMTTSTVPVVYEFENRTFYTCSSSASANISGSGGQSTQPLTSFHSPVSSAKFVQLHHLSASVAICHFLLALVGVIQL